MAEEQAQVAHLETSSSAVFLPHDRSHWARANELVMNSTPLGPAALGLMTGIVLSERAVWNPIAFVLLLLAASLSIANARIRTTCSMLIVVICGAAVGGLVHWSRCRVVDPSGIENVLASGDAIVRVRGEIVSEPAIRTGNEEVFSAWRRHEETTTFLLSMREVENDSRWLPSRGLLRATVNEAVLDLAEGDLVEVFGRLSLVPTPQNPGAFDWHAYFRQQGVFARLHCDQRENVIRIERSGPSFNSWIRTRTSALLTDDFSSAAAEESTLLEAMVLGHRSRFDRRLNDVFTRAGCVHFIAASGSNIVVLMASVWMVGRLMGFDKRRCAWSMIIAIVLYGLVAEARPPILRACVMGLLFCIALILQRASSHLNWIAAAAILLCLMNPLNVFDVGFQLSFAAVLGVAYLSPALRNLCWEAYCWLRQDVLGDKYYLADRRLAKVAEQFAPVSPARRFARLASRTLRVVGLVFAVSLGAWLCSLPITAAWFGQVQPWGVVSSVVVYPLVSIIMILGIAKVAIAVVSPTLASIATSILSVVDTALIRAVEVFAGLPAASIATSPPPWWLIAIFYLFLLAIAVSFRRTGMPVPLGYDSAHADNRCISRRGFRWTSGAIAVFACTALGWQASITPSPKLTITSLAVGNGSATIVELPTGDTLMYDAGSLMIPGAGRNIILPFLRFRGIHRIERLYVSHPNLDHFSAVPEILDQIPIGSIVWNHCFEALSPDHSPSAKFIKIAEGAQQTIEVLDPVERYWEFGGVLFETLWPPAGDCSQWSANDSSTVLRLTFGEQSILFTGDIEEVAESALLTGGEIASDVMILPHHGSVVATSRDFFDAVAARTLIRSSSQRMKDTTNGLADLGGDALLFNTADVGAIRIELEPQQHFVRPWMSTRLD